MLQPLLHSLHMIFGTDWKPLVTDVTQYTLGIEFADIRVLGQERVALFQTIVVLGVSV